VNELAMHGATA